MQTLQRGRAYTIEASRASSGCEVPVTDWRPPAEGRVTVLSQVAAVAACSTRAAEWKLSRAPSVTRGSARLRCWVVGALSSYSPQGAQVPVPSVPRWSPFPDVQTCGLGCSGPLLRAFIIPHYFSLVCVCFTLLGWHWLIRLYRLQVYNYNTSSVYCIVSFHHHL